MNEEGSNLSSVAMAFLVQSPKMNHTSTAKWVIRTRKSLTSIRQYFHGNIYRYLTDDLQVARLMTLVFKRVDLAILDNQILCLS